MSIEKALNKFGKDVIQQSKQRLTKQKINASKELYNSLDYNVKVSKNSFELSFEMEDYGKFIDKGVKGKEEDRTKNSPYKYTNKMPPSKAFDKWSIRRGIAPRSESGQFVSRKSINFAIARSVFLKGIETTEFFTKSFEQQFAKLPDELVEAYDLQVDKLLEDVL